MQVSDNFLLRSDIERHTHTHTLVSGKQVPVVYLRRVVGNTFDVRLMEHLVTVRNVVAAHDDHQRIIVDTVNVIIARVGESLGGSR